jgi:hypothetical protein
MKPEKVAGEVLSGELLDQIRGGMLPYRPQAGPTYDYSLNPRALGAVMGAGAITGGLGGAALGGVGAAPGAIGGALLGGIGYTAERMFNPTQVMPAMTFAVCHGAGATPRPMAMASCHKKR